MLTLFLTMQEGDVLDIFAGLRSPHGDTVACKPYYVYVPGADGAPLLVAHADTAGAVPTRVEWRGAIATVGAWDHASGWKVGGRTRGVLGADDRAGCAMLWLFRDGHGKGGRPGLLVTTGEESGGQGVGHAADDLWGELNRYAFAIEVDRRGDMEYVLYDVSTRRFRKFLHSALPEGWVRGSGTFTDISILCPVVGICGVNLAAGYIGEHTPGETLFLDAWERTRDVLADLLGREDLPQFKMNRRPDASSHGWWVMYDASFEPGDGDDPVPVDEAIAGRGSHDREEHDIMDDDDAAYLAWIEDEIAGDEAKREPLFMEWLREERARLWSGGRSYGG